jgi:hypothetical protein
VCATPASQRRSAPRARLLKSLGGKVASTSPSYSVHLLFDGDVNAPLLGPLLRSFTD